MNIELTGGIKNNTRTYKTTLNRTHSWSGSLRVLGGSASAGAKLTGGPIFANPLRPGNEVSIGFGGSLSLQDVLRYVGLAAAVKGSIATLPTGGASTVAGVTVAASLISLAEALDKGGYKSEAGAKGQVNLGISDGGKLYLRIGTEPAWKLGWSPVANAVGGSGRSWQMTFDGKGEGGISSNLPIELFGRPKSRTTRPSFLKSFGHPLREQYIEFYLRRQDELKQKPTQQSWDEFRKWYNVPPVRNPKNRREIASGFSGVASDVGLSLGLGGNDDLHLLLADLSDRYNGGKPFSDWEIADILNENRVPYERLVGYEPADDFGIGEAQIIDYSSFLRASDDDGAAVIDSKAAQADAYKSNLVDALTIAGQIGRVVGGKPGAAITLAESALKAAFFSNDAEGQWTSIGSAVSSFGTLIGNRTINLTGVVIEGAAKAITANTGAGQWSGIGAVVAGFGGLVGSKPIQITGQVIGAVASGFEAADKMRAIASTVGGGMPLMHCPVPRRSVGCRALAR